MYAIGLILVGMIAVQLWMENNTGTAMDDEGMRRLATMTLLFIALVWLMVPILYASSFWAKLVLGKN